MSIASLLFFLIYSALRSLAYLFSSATVFFENHLDESLTLPSDLDLDLA